MIGRGVRPRIIETWTTCRNATVTGSNSWRIRLAAGSSRSWHFVPGDRPCSPWNLASADQPRLVNSTCSRTPAWSVRTGPWPMADSCSMASSAGSMGTSPHGSPERRSGVRPPTRPRLGLLPRMVPLGSNDLASDASGDAGGGGCRPASSDARQPAADALRLDADAVSRRSQPPPRAHRGGPARSPGPTVPGRPGRRATRRSIGRSAGRSRSCGRTRRSSGEDVRRRPDC